MVFLERGKALELCQIVRRHCQGKVGSFLKWQTDIARNYLLGYDNSKIEEYYAWVPCFTKICLKIVWTTSLYTVNLIWAFPCAWHYFSGLIVFIAVAHCIPQASLLYPICTYFATNSAPVSCFGRGAVIYTDSPPRHFPLCSLGVLVLRNTMIFATLNKNSFVRLFLPQNALGFGIWYKYILNAFSIKDF